MIILTIRSDKPEAELGLFKNSEKLEYDVWLAHYHLSETIHTRISEILERRKKDWKDLDGIICFKGPGSFTGLRIGLSSGNALSYSLEIPIVGTKGSDWIDKGIKELADNKNDKLVLPYYGSKINISLPKK